jgi:hypothetical protein
VCSFCVGGRVFAVCVEENFVETMQNAVDLSAETLAVERGCFFDVSSVLAMIISLRWLRRILAQSHMACI